MRREVDYEGGLMIGTHVDPETLRKQKILAQRIYQQQLEDDQIQKSGDSRRDYEPRRVPTYSARDENNLRYGNYPGDNSNVSNSEGFIGIQKDPETIRQSKLLAQRAYQQQLEDDLAVKAASKERKYSGRRRTASPSQAETPLNSLNIGSYESSLQEEKRREAMRIAARNREEAYARMQENGDSLERAPRLRPRRVDDDSNNPYSQPPPGENGRSNSRPPRQRDREADQRAFEDSDNKLLSIGGRGAGDQRRQAADIQQRNYDEAQLRAHANLPRRDREAETRAFEEAEYKHIGGLQGGSSAAAVGRRSASTGRTGLGGGGSARELQQSKAAAQAQYVAQLQADAAYSAQISSSDEQRGRRVNGGRLGGADGGNYGQQPSYGAPYGDMQVPLNGADYAEAKRLQEYEKYRALKYGER